MAEKKFYTSQEVAVMLDVAEGTVMRWARQGAIPARKIGPRLWRFPKDELDRWFSSQRNVQPEPALGIPAPQEREDRE